MLSFDIEPGDTLDIMRDGEVVRGLVIKIVGKHSYQFIPNSMSLGAFQVLFADKTEAYYDLQSFLRIDNKQPRDADFILGLSDTPLKLKTILGKN
jgi:hypothetical protein